DQAHHHIKGGGFASAIGAQQPNHFATRHFDIDIIDNTAAFVGFDQAFGPNHRVSWAVLMMRASLVGSKRCTWPVSTQTVILEPWLRCMTLMVSASAMILCSSPTERCTKVREPEGST